MADGRRNNGGNPTNGGRKSARDERLMASVVNMSWERIKQGLEQNRWKEEKKDEVAEHFALKSMPKDIKLGGGVKVVIMPQEIIDKNRDYESDTITKDSSTG